MKELPDEDGSDEESQAESEMKASETGEQETDEQETAPEESEESDEDAEKKEPEEFSLSAMADNIIVTLTARTGDFGDVMPEDMTLSVRKIEDAAAEAERIEEAVSENRAENVTPVSSYKFDITVLDASGIELQPVDGAVVRVSFALAEVVDSNLNVNVYHVKEQSAALTAEELTAEESVSGEEARGDETVVTVETDGFSYYVVEFTYNSLEYVLRGDESIKLSEILTALGLSGKVDAAESGAPELFSVEKDEEGDDWTVTALQPFTSEEWMKVTIDGVEYRITVTDDSAPGTRQQITKEELEGGIFFAYHAVENGVTLTLYCFNSELAWPVTGNPDLTDYYVPDNMLTLSEDVKDKVYRVFYAGYPHNNLGMYATGDEPITYSELADAVVPPEALMDLMPDYDWDNLNFTPEKLIGSTPESSVMDELLWSMFDDECYAAMMSKPDFLFFLSAWQFGPYSSVDELLEGYSSMKPMATPGDVHDATQIAIWRILYENGVPNNNKPLTEELNNYPIARQLVDFANGVGEYADAYIPPRNTKIDEMQAYKADFETGSKLLRADGTPVGADGIIVFTENENGEYVSEPLHFANGTYALPYTITLSNGTTVLSSVINHGSGEFVLYSPSRATNAQVTVETENMYPSDVYQYVVESQKDIPAEQLSHDAGHVQDMSGVYYQSVPMSLSFGTEFRDAVKTGSLRVSKTVANAPNADSKEFSFTVTLSDESISGTYGTMTFTNGVATFALKDGHSVHARNLPAGITYTVEEADYSGAGFTTSSVNAEGTIVADETAEVSFVNTYKAAATEIALSGTKTMTGKDLTEDEFSFIISGSEDGISRTVKNKADGSIDFGTYEFKEPGTYEYTVREVNDGKTGVTYDSTIYHVTVTVTDNGNGQLAAAISGCAPTGDDLNFTNSYQAHSTSVAFGGEKIFSGFPKDSAEQPQFTFVLKENGAELDRRSVTLHGEYEFAAITYTQSGEHTYTVEELKGSQPGVTYDEEVYEITVSVADVDGELVATIGGDTTTGDDLDFGNSYQAEKTEVSLSGTKTLTGKTLEDEEFSFTIIGHDDGLHKTVKNDANGNIDFGTHEYTAAGEYRYTVTEDVTNEPGVTYDSHVYEFTVTVSDNGTGSLEAVISGNTTGDDLNFTNSYKAGSTFVQFGGHKVFQNFPADSEIVPEFTFVLRDGTGKIIDNTKVTLQGAYDFQSITYTEAGEYDYTVEEIGGHQAGVTYDHEVYKIHVKVADVNGKLQATVSGDSETGTDLNFTNSYQAKAAEVHMTGTKTLEGKDLTADEFSFTLIGHDDGVSVTVKNDADGKIDFGTITYTKAGTYRYTAKENNTAEAGVTYDSAVYEFVVTVTDDGRGHLIAVFSGATTTGSDLDFENTYKAHSTFVAFGGTKTFNGFPEDSSIEPVFTFVLKENGTELERRTVTHSGEYSFSSITYDAAGAHDYTVEELAGDQSGVTYDNKIYSIHVDVTDVNGQFKAEISGDTTTGTDLNFTNGYKAASAELHMHGTKTLEGKELEADEFSFTITGLDDGADITVTNDANGRIDFGKHYFEQAGTYRYTVKENNNAEAGVTYDSTIYNFTVTVTDSGNGQLHAEVSGNLHSASDIHFTNRYEAGSTSVTFGGSKTFNGFPEDSSIKPVFTFILKENGEEIDRKTVEVSGDYSFGSIMYDSISYETAGSHDYTVEEIAGDQMGVTYDSKVYAIHVDVTDVGGQLSAAVSGDSASGADLDFTNSYEAASVDVHFSGRKTLEGKALTAGEFSFTLTGSDGTNETVQNTADGRIRFSALTFTEAGVYTYTVKEDLSDEAGVTIDSRIYNITVTVTDSGNGQLEAVISGDTSTGSDLNFVNTYAAGSTSLILGGTKAFTGFPEGSEIVPEFEFTLSENGEVIDTQKVSGSGEYAFNSITYTESGDHTYTVRETAGNQNGITYDDTVYTVTVSVKDVDAHLVVTVSGVSAPDALDFTNSYKADAAEVVFRGKKTMEGRDLEADEFSFTLADENGVIETVTNAADGSISFSALTFDEAGVYTYTVKEEAAEETGVTYDSRVYEITVTVTDNGDGRLAAVISGDTITGTDLNFINSFATGSLKIRKTVAGDLGDKNKEFSFVVTLSCEGSYPYAGSKSGTIHSGDTIKLKHGESITITDLPAGTTYTVTESRAYGYRVKSTGSEGTISGDTTSLAAFVNTRSSTPITGDNSNLTLWIAALAASAAGISAAMFFILKKRSRSKS